MVEHSLDLDRDNDIPSNQQSLASEVQPCPCCGLADPGIVQRCDCGYDFAEQIVRSSGVTPRTAGGFAAAAGDQRMLAFCVDMVAASVGATLLANLSGMWLLWFIAIVAYYFLSEAFTGRTLGKALAGTHVVSLQGGKPALGALLIRSVVRWIPGEALSGLGKKHSWWHDRWSRTRVVKTTRRAQSTSVFLR